MIGNASSASISLALRRIELRYSTQIKTIWSDNFSSLCQESLGPFVQEGLKLDIVDGNPMININDKNSYIKCRTM